MSSGGKLRSLKALGIASVLAPAVLFSGYAWLSYDRAFRDAEARASRLTGLLQEHAHRVFEAMGLALNLADRRLAGFDWETIGKSRPLWEELRRIKAAAPQIDAIFVLGPNGDLPLTTREFPVPPIITFSDRDYYTAQRDKDAGLFLGQAYTGKISKVPIFNFSIRRSSVGGEFDGVIGASAHVAYFQDFFATVGDPEDNFAVVLFQENGNFLARYPASKPGDKFGPTFLAKLNGSAGRVIHSVSPVDGLERIYAAAKVHEFPAYIAYSVERASIVSRWANGLIAPGALALAMALALLFMTSLVLQRARAESEAVRRLRETAVSLKREIEARTRAEASLLQAQRLEALGQLTGGIAHDFNNLLMVILGNLDMALRRTDPSAIQRLIKTAHYAGERGAGLVRQLLAFSRGQELRPEVVDLNELLGHAHSWMGRAMTEAIELEFDCAPDLWPVRLDIGQLEAALLNLTVNARDAMNGKGTLTLRTRNVTIDSRETPGASLRPGHYVEVSVSDTGSGIAPDVLARIYEPFFTTKEVGKGSGLGLSQVHGFIRQSGGDISINSEVGKGTTVTLILPRCEAAAAPPVAAAEAPAVSDLASAGKVILVVEDDDEVRKVSTRWLEELGHVPIWTRSGSEALALLSAGERIDALFTDVILPHGMTGIELVGKAREARPNLPALVTTASPGGNLEIPILRKPFSKLELAQALHVMFEGGSASELETGAAGQVA